MSIENNLIGRKKSKIKSLRRLNLDLPDELMDNDNDNASVKPLSKNQAIESYQDLTHRSLFYPKPLKIENLKNNLSSSRDHIENIENIENKLSNENNLNDEKDKERYVESANFSNKEKQKDNENSQDNQEEKENEEKKNYNE